jgi:hypothetical protein
MSEVIGISFTPSREYREHVNRRYINERSYGATAGDSFWMGYGDYDEVDPFARYREPEESKQITNPFWRARIEKARADRAAVTAEWAIRDAAEAITDDEFDVWFNTITKG